MFNRTSSLESHFIVDLDGAIWQLMDTSRQADANLQANGYAISIETADRGDPDRQPWTSDQIESLAWLHAELRRVHPTIPRRESRSCSDPGGLGYHTLHGAPSCWTPVSKSCPGTVRKGQWRSLLLPAFLNQEEESDMTPEQARQLNAIFQALIVPGTRNPEDTMDMQFFRMREVQKGMIPQGTRSVAEAYNLLFARVRTIEHNVATLLAQLGAEPPPPPP